MKGFSAPVGLLFCALLMPGAARCQDYRWHPRTSISFSLNYSQLRDDNVKPFSFTGPGVGAVLERRYEADFFYQTVELGGYLVAPKAAKEKSSRSLAGSGIVKYAFMLNRAFGSEGVSVGLFAKVSVKDAFYKTYTSNRLFWANFAGVGAAISWEGALSENYELEAKFEIPLAGIAFRPLDSGRVFPKNTIGNVIKSNTSNGNFANPGNYLCPSLSLGILSSKQSFLRSVSYKYSYSNVKTAVSKTFQENNHALVFAFMIGK